jgi:hypothetical protein
VLSHSRKAYSEATFTQTTDDFLRAWRTPSALRRRAEDAVSSTTSRPRSLHPDWFDPELTPKVQSFCQHYGTVILPTRPYMPRHKGKVESGVKYVKNNALQGRKFASLEEQSSTCALGTDVADTRIHGTTKQQVGKVFQEERPALLPLPRERFANFHEAQRKVNRDGHVEVAKAYYSVPPEYLGREVWARWDARLVRIFNGRWEQIAVHVRHEQGRFSTHGQHWSRRRSAAWNAERLLLLSKVGAVGPDRRSSGLRPCSRRGASKARASCKGCWPDEETHQPNPGKSLRNGPFARLLPLRTIRQLLKREAAKQQPLPFLDEHPLIRPLDDYAAVVAQAIHRQAGSPLRGRRF